MKAETYQLLNGLNELARLFASFGGLRADFDRSVEVVSALVPVRSVVLIEALGGKANFFEWHAAKLRAGDFEVIRTRSWAAFAYMASPSLWVPPGAVDLPAVPLEPNSNPRLLTLPLVVDSQAVFGILQIECLRRVDEPVLAFINAYANQLASAIDRRFAAQRQGELERLEAAGRRRTAALQAERDAARAADSAKTRFLANISHEIRTPLVAILGFADLLTTPRLGTEERLKFANTIKTNGTILARLIDDILDLTKVEAGKIDLESQPCHLPGLIDEVVSLLSPQAEAKGVEVRTRYDATCEGTARVDATRLKQVLLNVVGNAIKFTQKGFVAIEARVAESGKLSIDVRDTGIGISPREASSLFQPFCQADSSTSKKYGGSGLGLVLSRRIAEAMGGTVELKGSVPGKWSLFCITVDAHFEPSDGAEKGVRAKPVAFAQNLLSLKGKEILLVDDVSDNRLLFNEVLRRSGALVDLAVDGVDGVSQAMRKEYDVVLMDLQMPNKDGYAAASELRRRGYSRPIIALSAFAMREERTRAIEAGCDDHLAKPISPQQLLQRVRDVVDNECRH